MNLSERIAQLSPEQWRIFELKLKQQNIDILQMKAQKIPESRDMWAIKPAEKKEYYPLSTSQKRLYILNLFKAGGAYLPLEVNAPGFRIAHILADSASILMLSDRVTLDSKLLNLWNGEIVIYDAGISTSYPFTLSSSHLPNSSNLAYVIYTSSSTGKPKGVMVEHHSIVYAAFAWLQEYKLTEMEVILLQVANFSFDVFTGDLARVFSSSGIMLICQEEVRVDPPTFYLLVETQQ